MKLLLSNKLIILIAIMLVLAYDSLYAQNTSNYIIKMNKVGTRENVKDKLMPMSMVQDKNNFIWYQNQKNVYRYDGDKVVHVNNIENWTNFNSKIINISNDKVGNVLFYTQDALYRYDVSNGKKTKLQHYELLKNGAKIRNIWNNEHCVIIESTDKFISVVSQNISDNNEVSVRINRSRILEDGKIDNVNGSANWLGYRIDDHIFFLEYNNGKIPPIHYYFSSMSKSGMRITKLIDAHGDNIRLKAYYKNNYYIINAKMIDGNLKILNVNQISQKPIGQIISIDSKNELIVYTDFKLAIRNVETDKLEDITETIKSNFGNYTEIYFKYKTKDGSIWLWNNEGWILLKISPKIFKNVLNINLLKEYSTGVSIRNILPLNDEEILFSSYGLNNDFRANLHKYNRRSQEITSFISHDESFYHIFYKMKWTSDNRIVMLTEEGFLFEWDTVHNTRKVIFERSANEIILKNYDFEFLNGKYLIATSDGLYMYNPVLKSKEILQWSDDIQFNHINRIDDSKMLISSSSGLYMIDTLGKIIQEFGVYNKFPNLYQDILFLHTYYEDSVMWASSNYGLFRFDLKSGDIKRYGINNGMVDEHIYTTIKYDSSLWISTNSGISRMDLATEAFVNYGTDDGLPANEFNNNAYAKNNNHLFFGSVNGLVFFSPDKLIFNSKLNINFYRNSISYISKKKFYKKYTINDKDLNYYQLPADASNIEISYILPEYIDKKNVRLKYKLSYENSWTIVQSNKIKFNYLPSDNFTLEVYFSLDNKHWSTNKDLIYLNVEKYWYNTVWFYLLLGLGIFIIGYAIIRNRINQINRVLKIRNKISSDVHDEIGSTLSSISIFAHTLFLQSQDEKQRSILAKIKEYSSLVQESISDIIWTVKPEADKIDELISRIRNYGADISESAGFEFVVDYNIEEIKSYSLDMISRKNIYMILKEAINNAVKYSKASIITLRIYKSTHNKLTIKVMDNGIGYDDSTWKSGNGLKNMKRRAEEINSEIEIKSTVGVGTEITITV